MSGRKLATASGVGCLQGQVLLRHMLRAAIMDGVAGVLALCRAIAFPVSITIDKTEHGDFDPERQYLRSGARAWLDVRGFFGADCFDLLPNDRSSQERPGMSLFASRTSHILHSRPPLFYNPHIRVMTRIARAPLDGQKGPVYLYGHRFGFSKSTQRIG